MGEIDRVGAYVVRIYSNEPRFEEPHVHVWRGGSWVKVRLPTKNKAAELLSMSRRRMASGHVIEAVRLVEENADKYRAEYRRLWRQRHGEETD